MHASETACVLVGGGALIRWLAWPGHERDASIHRRRRREERATKAFAQARADAKALRQQAWARRLRRLQAPAASPLSHHHHPTSSSSSSSWGGMPAYLSSPAPPKGGSPREGPAGAAPGAAAASYLPRALQLLLLPGDPGDPRAGADGGHHDGRGSATTADHSTKVMEAARSRRRHQPGYGHRIDYRRHFHGASLSPGYRPAVLPHLVPPGHPLRRRRGGGAPSQPSQSVSSPDAAHDDEGEHAADGGGGGGGGDAATRERRRAEHEKRMDGVSQQLQQHAAAQQSRLAQRREAQSAARRQKQASIDTRSTVERRRRDTQRRQCVERLEAQLCSQSDAEADAADSLGRRRFVRAEQARKARAERRWREKEARYLVAATSLQVSTMAICLSVPLPWVSVLNKHTDKTEHTHKDDAHHCATDARDCVWNTTR
jgi:hypothetical protein